MITDYAYDYACDYGLSVRNSSFDYGLRLISSRVCARNAKTTPTPHNTLARVYSNRNQSNHNNIIYLSVIKSVIRRNHSG